MVAKSLPAHLNHPAGRCPHHPTTGSTSRRQAAGFLFWDEHGPWPLYWVSTVIGIVIMIMWHTRTCRHSMMYKYDHICWYIISKYVLIFYTHTHTLYIHYTYIIHTLYTHTHTLYIHYTYIIYTLYIYTLYIHYTKQTFPWKSNTIWCCFRHVDVPLCREIGPRTEWKDLVSPCVLQEHHRAGAGPWRVGLEYLELQVQHLIQRKVEVVQLKNCQIRVFWSRYFYSHPFLFLCVNVSGVWGSLASDKRRWHVAFHEFNEVTFKSEVTLLLCRLGLLRLRIMTYLEQFPKPIPFPIAINRGGLG